MHPDHHKFGLTHLDPALLKQIDNMALDDINVADPALFKNDTVWPYFARLRREDPIHFCKDSLYGPYWSITRYEDIMAVEKNHKVFSSDTANGGITIEDGNLGLGVEMFIAMDPPKHDEQRKAVSPIVSPQNLARLEETIRTRSKQILSELPIGETFDVVDRVSIELTTQMLATLFDFPWDDRRKLTHWSDVATSAPGAEDYVSEEYKRSELGECLAYFTRLWNERVNAEPGPDLISMLAHSDATRHMTPNQFLGNLILLIVGGNDTTRNTMTGSILALNQNPEQYQLLCDNPELVNSMVPELIRWQTPLASMRRTAIEDFEIGGKLIHKGDKVVLWYASANLDPDSIDHPEQFIINRRRPRQHISFGFGIHRCVGNRLAEMQLRIIWEEALKKWPQPCIEVMGEPDRSHSVILRGYNSLPVRINALPQGTSSH